MQSHTAEANLVSSLRREVSEVKSKLHILQSQYAMEVSSLVTQRTTLEEDGATSDMASREHIQRFHQLDEERWKREEPEEQW